VAAPRQGHRGQPRLHHRLWRKFCLPPHRSEGFKFSTGPQLDAKVRDVAGLYLNPPENAAVLCTDEKSQCQALERTQPIQPMRSGIPERQTCDYGRHGVTCLFAALDAATGKVTDAGYPRQRHQKFRFLKKDRRRLPGPGTPRRAGQLRHLQAR
jgi:hypothetical protein